MLPIILCQEYLLCRSIPACNGPWFISLVLGLNFGQRTVPIGRQLLHISQPRTDTYPLEEVMRQNKLFCKIKIACIVYLMQSMHYSRNSKCNEQLKIPLSTSVQGLRNIQQKIQAGQSARGPTFESRISQIQKKRVSYPRATFGPFQRLDR